MVSITYDSAYGVYEAAEKGHVFIALPNKQEVIDTLRSYGYKSFIDRTLQRG